MVMRGGEGELGACLEEEAVALPHLQGLGAMVKGLKTRDNR